MISTKNNDFKYKKYCKFRGPHSFAGIKIMCANFQTARKRSLTFTCLTEEEVLKYFRTTFLQEDFLKYDNGFETQTKFKCFQLLVISDISLAPSIGFVMVRLNGTNFILPTLCYCLGSC
jgi:hypothetical protein